MSLSSQCLGCPAPHSHPMMWDNFGMFLGFVMPYPCHSLPSLSLFKWTLSILIPIIISGTWKVLNKYLLNEHMCLGATLHTLGMALYPVFSRCHRAGGYRNVSTWGLIQILTWLLISCFLIFSFNKDFLHASFITGLMLATRNLKLSHCEIHINK